VDLRSGRDQQSSHIASRRDSFPEAGLPELSYTPWYGLFAPNGTSKEIISKLNAATVEALADPAVRFRFTDLRLEIFPRD
jgi:tripartite-type tricarboxylate transporter receptor subunit TctC